jgi:phosphoribosylanthranilate isomerase
MAPPLLKVCGLTTIADLRVAQTAGADFLGVVVESDRPPRSLALPQAAVLARLARNVVAVTLCADPARLREIVRAMQPRALQLHGPEAPNLARELSPTVPVWVAVGITPTGSDAGEILQIIAAAATAGAEMVVLDTAAKGQTGGTGQTSDWTVAADVVARSPLPVLLAGGIGPGNAAAALARVRPAGLDASSRLEASPGRKDPARVRAMARVVRAAEAAP